MCFERRPTVARAKQCRYTARRLPALDPADGRRGTDTKHPGGFPSALAVDVKSLHAKIGELTLENDFLEGALTKAGLLSARPDGCLATA